MIKWFHNAYVIFWINPERFVEGMKVMAVKACRRLMCIALVILALVGASVAFAVETEEYGAKYLVNDDASMVDVDIIDFKVRLYELGFYSAGVSDSTLQTRGLDDLTMAAVKLVCKLNPDLVYYTDGVSNALYWRVMGLVDGELATPLDKEYRTLAMGESGEEITKVQNRLNQLGYDAVQRTFTPGVYDAELQRVIDEFIRCNKFVCDKDAGITEEMQALMFSDEAIPYAPPEVAQVEKTLSEKVMGYLGASGELMGLRLPNAAWLAAGFVLLCVIVLLVFMLLSPSKQGGKKSGKPKPGMVEFRVEYGDDCVIHRVNVSKGCVRIGRATGNFPLNMADESISRKHCEICYENGNLMLRDFSTYGTTVNGSKCHHSQQALKSGDVLEVGMHRITVNFQK